MRRNRSEYLFEPPFPWLGIVIGTALGLAIVPALSWLGFELIDQSLGRFPCN